MATLVEGKPLLPPRPLDPPQQVAPTFTFPRLILTTVVLPVLHQARRFLFAQFSVCFSPLLSPSDVTDVGGVVDAVPVPDDEFDGHDTTLSARLKLCFVVSESFISSLASCSPAGSKGCPGVVTAAFAGVPFHGHLLSGIPNMTAPLG